MKTSKSRDTREDLGRYATSSYGIQSPVRRHAWGRKIRGSHSPRMSPAFPIQRSEDSDADSVSSDKESLGEACQIPNFKMRGEKAVTVRASRSRPSKKTNGLKTRQNSVRGTINDAKQSTMPVLDVLKEVWNLILRALSPVSNLLVDFSQVGGTKNEFQALGSDRADSRPRHNTRELGYAPRDGSVSSRANRPRSPPPPRFRNISMSQSDALSLVEVPIIVPGKFTGRVDGYPVNPPVEEQLEDCRSRVKSTAALIRERWASIHAAHVILRLDEESPSLRSSLARNERKPSDIFIDSLSSHEQAYALWSVFRSLFAELSRESNRSVSFGAIPTYVVKPFARCVKSEATLGFRGVPGSTDLDNLGEGSSQDESASSAVCAEIICQRRILRRRICHDLAARFRL